jgi:dephospho-CoA kinase
MTQNLGKTKEGEKVTDSLNQKVNFDPESTKLLSNTISEHSNNPNQLLVIVGMPGAGKSVVVKYLQSKGWNIIHFGSITMQEILKRRLTVNEVNERAIREELRKNYGMEAYAKLSIYEITNKLQIGPTVIDGLYSWSEYKFLVSKLSNPIFIIAIFTPKHLRYQRLLNRSSRPLTLEEAESRDFSEIEHLEKGGPIAIADFTIENSGTIEDFYSNIDKLLNVLSLK